MRIGERVNRELQDLLRPYLLQRDKAEYLSDKLPEKVEIIVWAHLSEEQREVYTEFVHSRSVRDVMRGDKTALEAITWLRKLCGHPLLSRSKNGNIDGESSLAETLRRLDAEFLVEQSPKLGLLVDLVKEFRDKDHRTLIFSQSTKMLDIIQSVLYDANVLRIDGSTKEQDRQMNVDSFNDSDGCYDAMLLSTKVRQNEGNDDAVECS